MRYEVYALFAAFSFGLNAVLVRRGMMDSTPVTATIVIGGVQLTLLSALLFFNVPEYNYAALKYFIFAGFFAAILGRTMNYLSIDKLGVPISMSLTGTNPLFAMIIAVIFLGERIYFKTILGSLMVVTGIVLISGLGLKSKLNFRELMIPLCSAFFYAFGTVMRKIGLNILPEPILGAVVGAATSIVAYPIILRLIGRSGELKINKKSIPWLIGGGITTSIAWVGMFTATQLGSVSVVSAIIGANPLFGLILSSILLKDTERITKQIAVGSVLIVLAMVLITLF